MGTITSHRLFNEAKKFIPGGVNSPVRSFMSVGGRPVFVKKGNGSKIYGECGGEFIDYCLSWGALILGHADPRVTESLSLAVREGTSFGAATELETELARLISEAAPSIERVRLTNSGTEAVMGAIRLARAFTGRNKIIKFEGSYHGHADYLLAESPGVPESFMKHTIALPYNDIKKVKTAVEKHKDDLAAIIMEPVAANCGVIAPQPDFLPGLRELTRRHDVLLIFDEVITGFRISYGGAQGFFNVKPDLTCLGKVIGGGLPVGAFGGRKGIMELLAPEGSVYQAGTLSGNPIAVTAGIVALNILKKDRPYATLKEKTKRLCEGIRKIAHDNRIRLKVNYIASIFSVFFTKGRITEYNREKMQDTRLFKKFFHGLLKKGIYLSPSGFEANFLSTAHNDGDIDKTLKAVEEVLRTPCFRMGNSGDTKDTTGGSL
jgi:glutamate-1-semialdehyde 2,1-aminomutase